MAFAIPVISVQQEQAKGIPAALSLIEAIGPAVQAADIHEQYNKFFNTWSLFYEKKK